MRSQLSFLFLPLLALTGCAPHGSPASTEEGAELLLFQPRARQVLFYSSRNRFEPQAAERRMSGYWAVTVSCDEEFTYFFEVDGNVHVPDCLLREQDDFGRNNCIYPKCL